MVTVLKNFLSIFEFLSFWAYIRSLHAWYFKVEKAPNIRVLGLPNIFLKGAMTVGRSVRIGRDVNIKVGANGWLEIQDGVSIGAKTKITVPQNEKISIGRNSRLNENCVIVDRVTIGEDVVISNGVQLISFSHQLFHADMTVDEADRNYGTIKAELKIGNGVFIGAKALLFGECIIGDFSTVSAGVLISKRSYPPNQIIYSANNFSRKRS